MTHAELVAAIRALAGTQGLKFRVSGLGLRVQGFRGLGVRVCAHTSPPRVLWTLRRGSRMAGAVVQPAGESQGLLGWSPPGPKRLV